MAMTKRGEEYLLARKWMRDLANDPVAPVSHRAPAGKVFIDVVIEGQRFQGVRRDDTLYISGPTGACPLGVASINEARLYDHMPLQWHICKYWHEATCTLSLSKAGLRALAITFGMPIVPEARAVTLIDLYEAEHFYDSSAFTALQAWALKSPRRLAGAYGDTYLGLWPLAALEGHWVEPTRENVARARARADGEALTSNSLTGGGETARPVVGRHNTIPFSD